MIKEAEIRDKLFDYLSRRISLNQFEDWLVQRSWNMHRDSDAQAQHLVGAIELRLAEYSDDHLSDDALDRELKGLLTPSKVVFVENAEPTAPVWQAGTTNESFSVALLLSQAA